MDGQSAPVASWLEAGMAGNVAAGKIVRVAGALFPEEGLKIVAGWGGGSIYLTIQARSQPGKFLLRSVLNSRREWLIGTRKMTGCP